MSIREKWGTKEDNFVPLKKGLDLSADAV
jgi:hypothetical protein